MKETPTVTRTAVRIIAGGIGILVLLFSAITTFTYGAEVIGAFIMPSIIGASSSALVSGLLTVLLFDAGWISGLFGFIYTAESVIQRAVAALQFAVNFIFSVTASVVSVLLLSPIAASLSPATLEAARYVGVAALLIALALNALAWAIQILASPNVAAAIRAATRQAQEIAFNDSMVEMLDRQTIDKARAEIEQMIPELSRQRAQALGAAYIATNGFKRAAGRPDVLDGVIVEEAPPAPPARAAAAPEPVGEPARAPFRHGRNGKTGD